MKDRAVHRPGRTPTDVKPDGHEHGNMRLIVHGGAGTHPEEPTKRQRALDAAAAVAVGADSPVGAVRTAVRTLESDPRFNAGIGSAVQSDGHIRTDAGVMTSDGRVGAACGMPGVEHAIDIADVVRRDTPHVLVSGVHAVDLGDAYGIEAGVDLWSERTRTRWRALDDRPAGDLRAQLEWVRDRFGGELARGDHDTVGAVAADGDRVAAATSTGGRWLALAGRVGDVPQVGSGFYCADSGGASATGAGEDIARSNLSRRAVDLLDDGHPPEEAADRAIEAFEAGVDGTAGVILSTPGGRVGAAHNSESMGTAVAGTVR